MPKTAVILQSNYIPWKGYFDLIRRADVSIVYDCVQYTRTDWRNRNQIKTPSGLKWLSVPVTNRFRDRLPIDAVEVANSEWAEAHIRSIEGNYRDAAAFGDEAPWLFDLLRIASRAERLSEVNVLMLKAICERVGIATPFIDSTHLVERSALLAMDRTDRLVQLCKAAGADRYLSGPAAREYMDVSALEAAGITVEWMNYEGYPPYPQQWGEFVHGVSIVDLILNVGAGRTLAHMVRQGGDSDTR